jgi:predicted RNA polymerase sigma factor
VALKRGQRGRGHGGGVCRLSGRALQLGDTGRGPCSLLTYLRKLVARGHVAVARAIELDPDFAVVWNTKGVVLAELGRIEEALDAFTRAADLDPSDAIAMTNKATFIERVGRSLGGDR